MKTRPLRLLLACAVPTLMVLLLVSCATEPVTGRRQFIAVAPAQDLQLGVSSFEKMKKEVPISKDPVANALVQKVGRRIAAVASLPNAQWEFVVFDSAEANAFCLPGGKVGVFTGILPITKDEAGLATVIGHEVAHASARHGAERMTTAMGLQMAGDALTASTAKSDPRKQAAATTVYGLASQLGLALPHSRLQEASADEIGIIFMARAGYDPEAAVAFWQRFAEYNRSAGAQTLWFLRTHPLDETRIETLKKWLPRAKQEFKPQS